MFRKAVSFRSRRIPLVIRSSVRYTSMSGSELVPISEVIDGLDDELVPAIRAASPQARHSFTVAAHAPTC